MAENIIFNVNVEGKDDLKNLEKGVENVGKKTNKTQSEMVRLRNEMKEAKNAMLSAEEGTDAYNRALRRASDAQFKLKDINDKTKAAVRDFGQTGRNVAQGVSGLAGGFSVLTGTMSLFSVENEFAAQALLKVQSAMAIASGVGQFADSIDSFRDIFSGLKASGQAATGAISEMSDVSKDAAGNLNNLGKETAVISSNLAGGATSIENTNKLLDSNNSIVNKLTESEIVRNNQVKFLTENQDKLSQTQLRAAKFNEIAYKSGSKTIEQYTELNSKIIESAGLTDKLNETNLNAAKTTDKLTDSTEKMTGATTKATASVGKQLLTMGVWVVAITAVIIGITKLVEWMNKIPNNVKVKMDIETEALENLKKNSIEVNKYVHDYKLAQKNGDKERLKSLDEVGKKEFNLTQEKLNQIKQTTNGWKIAFADYLKIAEDTYFNEAIIKKKVDAQITGRQSLNVAQELFLSQSDTGNFSGRTAQIGTTKSTRNGWSWEQLKAAAYKGGLTEKEYVDLQAVGIPQQIIDELRKVNLANSIIKSLPELREVYDYELKDNGNKPTKTEIKKVSPTLRTEKTTPKEIKDENLFWEEWKLRNITNLEKTQQEISVEMQKLPMTGANVFQLIDADIRLLNAELKDNQNELEIATNKYLGYEDAKNTFNKKNEKYKDDLDILNTYYKTEAELLDKLKELNVPVPPEQLAQRQKDIDLVQSKIATTRVAISTQEEKIAKELEELNTLKAGTKEYEDAYNKIIELGVSRDQIEEQLAQKRRDRWTEEISLVKEYLGAFSSFAGGMDILVQGQMDMTNKEYDAKIWANDEINQSDEQRQKNSERIEMQRYEALKENFEQQKKWKEAQAWMDFASGSVGIWTAPGITSLAPFGYILAGVQQAALLASTIGNVQSIRAQTLDKPHKSKGGSSSGYNIALNPKKEALTSQTEMLNTMNKNNIENAPQQFVKVTDINKVQNTVAVRDRNSKY